MPFKDFIDYLGLGHLYIGSIFTFIFGGSYKSSLVAFSFLSIFSTGMIALMIGFSIFNDKKIVFALTNIFLLMIIFKPEIYSNFFSGTKEIKDALNYSTWGGNSARFIRGLVLPFVVLLIKTIFDFLQIVVKKKHLSKKKEEILYISFLSFISGVAFVWSNDWGVCCWVAIFIMQLWLCFSKSRYIVYTLKISVIYLCMSILFIFICAEIFTFGNFSNWLYFTFGTGDYQRWYYNGSKAFYLFNIDYSYQSFLQFFIVIFYLIQIFRNRANNYSVKRYGVLAFMNLSSFGVINEYRLLSGGSNKEVSYTVLFFTITFECMSLLRYFAFDKDKIKKILLMVSFLVASGCLLEMFHNAISKASSGNYIAELGGNVTARYADLKEAKEFLKDGKFFATYASAQEILSGQFQPSGIDYIIHVLGDAQREKYMEHFIKEDFKYVATIKKEFTLWEYWVERANWFFYRELYRNYIPIFENSYERYWEKADGKQNVVKAETVNLRFEVIDISPQIKKIKFYTDADVDGFADVYIDYKVCRKKSNRNLFLLNAMLKVENTGKIFAENAWFESNYLRKENKEYIPVTIYEGYGEITLTSLPDQGTYLLLNNVKCDDIIHFQVDYIDSIFDKEVR